MDDKKFNDIMNNYISSKSQGKEVDFAKLENKQKVKKNDKKLKLIYSSVALLLIVAITLAIALPFTLNNETNNGGEQGAPLPIIKYFEPTQIEFIHLEDSDDLLSAYYFSADLPEIEHQDISVFALQDKEVEEIIGAYLEILIYDEVFDTVNLYVIPKSIKLSTLESFDDLIDETLWNDDVVKYYTVYSDVDFCYTTRSVCSIGDYEYYIEAIYYNDLQITELLNLIF